MPTKILIVDDDLCIRTLLSKFLQRQGFETILAEDGLAGVEIAKKFHPDLIILDVVMPRMDGFRAARLIKFYKPLMNIPIVFLTARNTANEIEMAQKTRAEAYITKPFEVHQILLIINKLLSAVQVA